MLNKVSKFLKKEKSPTANVEAKPLLKEPHSALAVVVVEAVVAKVVVKNRQAIRKRKRKRVAVAMMTARRKRVAIKTIAIAKINSRLTGLKLPSSVPNVR